MDYEAYLKQVLETHSLADDSSEIKDLRAEKENARNRRGNRLGSS